MDKKTSFKLRPSNQHLELVNPRVADLTDVYHRAWTSLHDIDHAFDLDDNLGSWAQFQKLIHTTSFRINQSTWINTWIFKIQQLLIFKEAFDRTSATLQPIMQIKKFPKVAVVATKLSFLQYTYIES